MSFTVDCNFEKGSENQHFQNTLLAGWERARNKGYPVYALDNVDSSGRPLIQANGRTENC